MTPSGRPGGLGVTLQPMTSTLPNTDQPRIPHSEYHRRESVERLSLGKLSVSLLQVSGQKINAPLIINS